MPEREGTPERIELIDVDDYTEPADEPDYYAVYVRMSREPGAMWRQCFADEWRKVPSGLKRVVTVVGARLRLEIHGDDALQEQLDFVDALVRRANVACLQNTPK